MNRNILGALLIVALSTAILAGPALAGPKDQPPPLSGWTHSPKYPDDTAAQHGLVLSGKSITFGSPVIADLDGSTANGSEVVVGGSDGRLYAIGADGKLRWQKDVPAAGCSGETLIFGKPTVGALFGDGVPYVVVGYGSRSGADGSCDGGVVVYRGSDGQQTWVFSLKAFDSQTPEGPEGLYGVISSVALADTDGDGKLELAFGGLDRNLYLLNADRSLRWYYHAADSIWSTPLFINIDADPQLELIAGTDIRGNAALIPPTSNGGFVHAFETTARSPARIPFQTGFIWRTHFDQVIYSSPLAAELLSGNSGLEIAVGSGCYYPEGGGARTGAWVKLLRPADGAVIQTLNAPGCVQSSPAAGDLDDDGKLELAVSSRGNDGRGHIVAWDPESATPKWDRIPYNPNSPPGDPSGQDAQIDLQSPVIADLDGNGSLEVLASNFWSVHVLSGRDGSFLTCQNNGCGGQLSLYGWGTLKATPAVGDINGDGKLDVVIGGMHVYNDTRAHIYAWTNFAGLLGSPQGSQTTYSAPWPQFRRDALANGVMVDPALTASATSISAIASGRTQREYRVGIGSTDGSSVSPTVSEVSDQGDIVTARLDGSVLTIQVDTAGKPAGTYSAELKVASPGLPDLPVTVSARVVDSLTTVALPATMR